MKTLKDCPYCIRHNSSDCKHCFEVEKPEEKPVSETPWTDERERVGKIRSSSAVMGVVPAVYVRELERKLASTEIELEQARAEIDRRKKIYHESLDVATRDLDIHLTLLNKTEERLSDKNARIKQMLESMEDFVSMFTDTKKYPDPETVTIGLRILLPKMLIEIEAAKGGK